MDHFRQIYASRARDYHNMIAAEDASRNLPAALTRLLLPPPQRILDLGTGTGRIPLLLAPMGYQVVGLDLSAAMLAESFAQRGQAAVWWDIFQADMRRLPHRTGDFDAVIAGWSIGHLRGWYAFTWQAEIGCVLSEMRRVTRPGGSLIILETLGTGSLDPAPPTPELDGYYDWLENTWGFKRTVIGTEYHFADVESAVHNTEFFFGPELASEIRKNRWAHLPEWTGVWSRSF